MVFENYIFSGAVRGMNALHFFVLDTRTLPMDGYNVVFSPLYYFTMTHNSDILLCVMRVIERNHGAMVEIWQFEVRNGLAASL